MDRQIRRKIHDQLDDPPGSDSDFLDGGLAGLSSDWSVAWSDLMMVLFVLFAVLFLYERSGQPVEDAFDDPRAEVPEAVEGSASVQSVYQQSRELLRGVDLQDVEVALGADDSVRLRVRGSTFFDLGKADLKPETRRFLDGVAEVLRGNRYEIHVVGHTDSFPIRTFEFPTNWELSVLRATRVTRHLIERGRLEPGRFTVMGNSMYRPRVSNDTLDRKSLNRRVEIVITRQLYQPESGL